MLSKRRALMRMLYFYKILNKQKIPNCLVCGNLTLFLMKRCTNTAFFLSRGLFSISR